MEELITMSKKELMRTEVVQKVIEKHIYQRKAAEILGLTVRQVKRLCRAYRQQGPQGLVSKKRGKPSARRTSAALKTKVVSLIKERYYDFGPTLASEKLKERDDIDLSTETVRQIMIEHEIWVTRLQRMKRSFQPRNRREAEGELVQIDGSDHEWFEERAPRYNLLVYNV